MSSRRVPATRSAALSPVLLLPAWLPGELLTVLGLLALTGLSLALGLHLGHRRASQRQPEPQASLPGPSQAGPEPETAEPEPAEAEASEPEPSTAVALPDETPFQRALRQGQAAVDAGRYAQAIERFEAAIQMEPEAAIAHLCLGLCLAEMHRHGEALVQLETASRLRPEDPVARFSVARVLAGQGRHREALEALGPVEVEDAATARQILEDPAFQGLRDHPRFLAKLGRL